MSILISALLSSVSSLGLRNGVTPLPNVSPISTKITETLMPKVPVYQFMFEKAFDSVPHHLLPNKLHDCGFDMDFIHIFQSYLYGRTQCAKGDGVLSSSVSATSGVPQGSVNGPFPFILFNNDLPDAIGNSSYYLYCDD